jgi:hypothetical protein
MLKIKSKAILALTGLVMAAFLVVGAQSASADMVTVSSSGVYKSSSVSSVQALQTFLNWTLGSQITPLVVDGVYGAKTTAAVKLFQKLNPPLAADGVFGPKSAAVAMSLQASAGGVTYPAGCSSNSGFSTTTGAPCSGGALPAGCASAAGYSTTTGIPCSSNVGTTLPAGCSSAAGFSSTTGMPCTASTVSQGTNGYLTDLSSDSTGRVSTVYESEQDKVVAGFRATARLADQTVNRVRVTFTHTGTGSVNLSKYISSASLWYGSSKIATMAIAQADRATSTDVYTFNFAGLNAKIAKDQIGRFYVSVAANGSLDSVDAASGSVWTVAFPAGGVQAVSPDGSVDTYDVSGTGSAAFSFGKFSANGVKATVALSTTNPSAGVVTVNNTAATNNVNLLKFTVKATNSDLTLRKIPVQVTINGTTTATALSAVINTVKLYRDGVLVDSLDASAGATVSGSITGASGSCSTAALTSASRTCGFIFSNLSSPANMITAGTTAEFTVAVDLKQATGNYTAGLTIAASVVNADIASASNFSVQDQNGDQLTASSAYRVGSAIGETMTLLVNGVNVTQGAATITSVTDAGNVTSVTYNIPLTVTAIGDTVYLPQVAECAATITLGTGASAKAFSYIFQSSAAPTATTPNCGTSSSTLSSSDASVEGIAFRLDSGATKHFTLQVILTTPATASTSYRVNVTQVETFTEAALTTGSVQNLLPVQNYQTGYQFIFG